MVTRKEIEREPGLLLYDVGLDMEGELEETLELRVCMLICQVSDYF